MLCGLLENWVSILTFNKIVLISLANVLCIARNVQSICFVRKKRSILSAVLDFTKNIDG